MFPGEKKKGNLKSSLSLDEASFQEEEVIIGRRIISL